MHVNEEITYEEMMCVIESPSQTRPLSVSSRSGQRRHHVGEPSEIAMSAAGGISQLPWRQKIEEVA